MKDRKPSGARPGAPTYGRTAKASETARDPKVAAPDVKPLAKRPQVGTGTAAGPLPSPRPAAEAVAPALSARGAEPSPKAAPAAKPTLTAVTPAPGAKGAAAPAGHASIAVPAPPVAAPPAAPAKPVAPPASHAERGSNPAAAPEPAASPKPAWNPVRDVEKAVSTASAAVRPAEALVTLAAVQAVEEVRRIPAVAEESGETVRLAVTETAAATARGFVELNGKVLELLRAQSDAAFALWRATLMAGSPSEAVRAQTSGLHHLYETSAQQWKEVAETAARLMGEAAKPIESARPDRGA